MRSATLRRLNVRGRRLLAIPSLFALALALATPAAAASLSPASPAATTAATPAVEICGQGPAVVRPSRAILACADHGTIAEHLTWSSWTATQAVASGIVTWRTCFMSCGSSKVWDSSTADITLTDPMPEPGNGILFTTLDMHVTGPTPPGFMRDEVFSEAPLPSPHASVPGAPPPSSAPPAVPPQVSAAPSGTLGYAQIAGFWVDAGGPSGADPNVPGYTYAQVAAAITFCESSFEPGAIQPGEPYSTTGWGLWQITPGNSVPAWGTDFQVLDPWNNAEEAVYKFDAAGGFGPWTTYGNGCYSHHLQTTSADTEITDPGEYVAVGSAPSGTPSSPAADPGSTYGAPMAAAYAFWEGTGSSPDLWEAQGAAVSSLAGPTDRKMNPLGSPPTVGINDSNGYTYVYWVGTGPDYNLYEAYWNGSSWVGPVNQHMGPLGSEPAVAVSRSGTAYVFWEGTNGDLYEAQGPANGTLSGPYNRKMGPLGSAPTVGINSSDATFIYWEGQDGALWEGYWNGSGFVGPYDRGMATLGSKPSVAITPGGTAYVFWEGENGDLYEAQGPANGTLSGPDNHDMGPLGSAPTAGLDGFGNTFVYWEGKTSPHDLWEGYWNGSGWVGPFNRGQGPLGSPPAVAIYSYTKA
jgi:hypothetical protein